jgi:hypothetical protein
MLDGTWGTESFSTGKFYWEVVATTIGNGAGAQHYYGIASGASGPTAFWSPGRDTNGIEYQANGGVSWNSTGITTLAMINQGDVIGIQWDATNNTIQWSKNGTLQGSPIDISSGGAQPVPKPTFPAIAFYTAGTFNSATARFAQASWQYTPSAGFGPFDAAAGVAAPFIPGRRRSPFLIRRKLYVKTG